MPASGPLVVVPCDPRTPAELEAAARCLVSLLATAPGVEVIVLGDPAGDRGVLAQLQAVSDELGFGFGHTPVRRSLAAGANPALAEAHQTGRDAVLISADVELAAPGWLDALLARTGSAGPAAVVGGRILFPDGLIDHAGLQFSLLAREFVASHRFGPASLHEARVPRLCPVGPGLVLIRHRALLAAELLDEELPGLELLDFSLRCFAAGLECAFEPAAVGTRLSSPWRVEPSDLEKAAYARTRHALLVRHERDVARWAPAVAA